MLHRLTLFVTGSILVGLSNYTAIAQETSQVAFSSVNPGIVEPMLGNMKILQSTAPATLSVSVPSELAAQISILPPSLVEGVSDDPAGTTRIGFLNFGANSLSSDSQNNTANLPTGNTDLEVRMRVERPVAFTPGNYNYRLTLSVTVTPP
ncbi:hypothetical protein H6G17_05445 [Chroococcidiopsis sp. FACHB-1243]|uniref:hypothetical protein n=1 Tax=Chroococcidiopsis sp. [FACHB-1243] TaxID=2692781 RepID=UPI001780876D|nr:hypothetical protein [Chroococcidiopsis sp. [FACHB-1243]]MBD2304958.1 hypothetical protein [Chroococcidiopsis sp. [FACHB-1243]]